MKTKKQTQPKYSLNEEGLFCIENYNQAKSFSNFFPGIAGLWGTPMWVFYVNRGQAIASFGVESKDRAIMEFQPANKSYRLTALQGFRTFIKGKKGAKEFYWEPFQENLEGTDYAKSQHMEISSHDLTLREKNQSLGLEAEVNYFTLPDEGTAALFRRVTITNTSRKPQRLDLVDGMPMIVPYGLKDWLLKNMSRTVEAWVRVRNLPKKAAYYQLNVEVADTPRVTHITEGNFFYSFALSGSTKSFAAPIVEASHVFGASLDFLSPEAFLAKSFKLPKKQKTESKTPAAMARYTYTLPAGASHSFVSVFGYCPSMDQLNRFIAKDHSKKFVDQKAQLNRDIIDHIKNFALTNSGSQAFNLYAESTFLDNILRGGLPVTVKTKDGDVAFNVYSRKHGDLERDYNFFTVAPTFYSQGNGNYRDVNQNRRNDIFFNTNVREGHLVNFLNLSQADGYNPLIVRGTSFSFKEEKDIDSLIAKYVTKGNTDDLRFFMSQGFLPGDLLSFIEKNKISLRGNIRDFLGHVLALCQKQELATHGEGFWSDHWTYNLDLLESYLGVYPERLGHLLLECTDFNFYMNTHYVLPRHRRYVLTPYGVRQYHSVAEEEETEDTGQVYNHKLRSSEGKVYQTHLFCKLLCLIANKAATLDPSGIGIEMEADKPNWYDALNGLPGLLGSSISETMELKRYSRFLLAAVNQLHLDDHLTVPVFEELAVFISELTGVLQSETEDLAYWHKANDVKEKYREKVRGHITGTLTELTIADIRSFLQLIEAKTTRSFQKAYSKEGFLRTYFFHEVTDYQNDGAGKAEEEILVRPLKFKRHDLPLFLEGYVHAMKVVPREEALGLYQSVCRSGLYDKKLKMFKVNENLSSQTEEIGRTRIFPSGWLENESVWLHMEYKFMLELLRSGLPEAFYKNLPQVLVAFLKPSVYGRSILENSSFIASSAHEDDRLHGRGFVARLSGSTAEFLHMWLYMNVGGRPFQVNAKGNLILKFEPALAAWLFTKSKTSLTIMNDRFERIPVTLPKNTYAFKFLGKVLVVYHNPKVRPTFGAKGVSVQTIELTYIGKKEKISVAKAYLEGVQAQDVRQGKVSRIDLLLG